MTKVFLLAFLFACPCLGQLNTGENRLTVSTSGSFFYDHAGGPLAIFVRPCEGESSLILTDPNGQSSSAMGTESRAKAGEGTSLGQRTLTLSLIQRPAGNYTLAVTNNDDHTPKHNAIVEVVISTGSNSLPILPASNQVNAYRNGSTAIRLEWTDVSGAGLTQCVYYHAEEQHDDHDVHGSTCQGQLSLRESILAACDVTSPYVVSGLQSGKGYDFDVVARRSSNANLTTAYIAVRITAGTGSGAATVVLSSCLALFYAILLSILN